MKIYKPTSKFLKTYKDTNLISYIISSEWKIYAKTYPDGKIDSDWNAISYNDEVLIMRSDEAISGKYIVSEDVLPFRINTYCMSSDYGVVKIAWVEERDDHNVYYILWYGRSINHYGSSETLRYLTPEEIARYIC